MAEDEDAVARLVSQIQSFGWDERKHRSNLDKHKLDFADARRAFDNPLLVRRSDRHGEIRYQVCGIVDGREVALACTIEGTRCWIISARRASKGERRRYYDRLA